ncbi:UDP-glucose dehydrogenase family protein [Deinococcus radiotolerans]|uniref:UDP-glucose 6-dehydrogenase n=1 Tax=Deinococcus radiotolerans TaxID=1309407 RepID=A0ABQ2FN11_9DEIO|nr:UDP-glucose/GDP-mannose dehydrogenase family protein [Deinococcus radiotolerans]GGL09616.1 UDP-glucose 6-dehydrogenase [Deinococcus radiotolerans]
MNTPALERPTPHPRTGGAHPAAPLAQVTIIGSGYVGLNTGAVLAYLGHPVVMVDRDEQRVRDLQAGQPVIFEVGLPDLLSQTRAQTTFTTDLRAGVRDAQVIVIAVGTPPTASGDADTRAVEQAAQEIAEGLQDGQRCVVVVKSTVPIGTNRRVKSVIDRVLHARGVQAQVHYASNPEFLREGMALHDTLYPDRVVVGSDDPEALRALQQLYTPILEQTFTPPPGLPRPDHKPLPTLMSTDATSAELVKYASNAFLAVKISFINEVAGLCEKVGADVSEVARGMGMDIRIGAGFLQAGVGWGGSCFPKDVLALQAVAAEYGYTLPIVQAAGEVNRRQRAHMLERLQDALKVLRGRQVAVLGLTFKPGTSDLRESPGLDLIQQLLRRGAHVRAHDPVALSGAQALYPDLDLDWTPSVEAALSGADAVLLATAWPEYLHLDWLDLTRRMRTRVVLDGRNALPAELLRQDGVAYMGVGR